MQSKYDKQGNWVVAFCVSWKVILQWEFRGFSSKKWWEYCMIELLEDAG